MLELYWAYADYQDMMNLCEELICYVIKEIKGSLEFEYQGEILNFNTPWKRISFPEILGQENLSIEKLKEVLEKKLDKKLDKLSRSQVLKLCEEYIETQIGKDPVFVIDLLKALSPLAKSKQDNPDLVERFELFISGIEIANAYSELNDPLEQRKRFEDRIKMEEETKLIDYDFIEALEYGMPPAGGLGIGIDRLVMLVTNSASIREVLLFPLLKPESNQ
jgi:lysyl-tRNA synthetase class 2